MDDNADTKEALGTLLELEKGHEVKWALSAPEALSRVESFTPRDVALIDITMPGMPGNFIEGRK